MKLKILLLTLTLLVFSISLAKADIQISTPNGNVYGLNESVYVEGNITNDNSTTVSVYYYNTSTGLSSAVFWKNVSVENGTFNFTWFNETEGNWTIYVNTTNSSDSLQVELINPIFIIDESPSVWYCDRDYTLKNYYTQYVKILKNLNESISFSITNDKLQPFYMNEVYGVYTDCDKNNPCYFTARYLNLSEGTNILHYNYTVYYDNGNFFHSHNDTYVNVTCVWATDVLGNSIIFTKNSTICGEYFADEIIVPHNVVLKVCDYDGSSGGWVRFRTPKSPYSKIIIDGIINASGSGYRGAYIHYKAQSSVGGYYIFNNYARGEGPGGGYGGYADTDSNSGNVYSGGSGGGGYGGSGGSGGKGGVGSDIASGGGGGSSYGSYNDTSLYLGSGGGISESSGYSSSGEKYEWILSGGNGGGYVDIEGYNVMINGRVIVDGANGDIDVIDPAQHQATGGPGGGSGGTIMIHTYNFTLNGVLSARGGDGANGYALAGYAGGGGGGSGGRVKIFTYYLNGNGTVDISYGHKGSGSGGGDTQDGNDGNDGSLYHGNTDLPNVGIRFVSYSPIPNNLKDRTINYLWLGEENNITFEVYNYANYTISGSLTLHFSGGYQSSNVNVILNAGEKKNVTASLVLNSSEVLRGFGLDSVWAEFNNSFAYDDLRYLPNKSVYVLLKSPDRVQAGGLFSIYVNFTPYRYSILYPHVMLDLNGTFGYETGVSSANIGGGFTSGRCYDTTIWSSDYEPGSNGHYTTTDAGTTVYSDSLNLVPQHKYLIYDEYGFLNKTRGNQTYEIGKILTGYGIIEPGDWKMFGSYDFMINGFSAEAGSIYSDWNLGTQFLYKFLDITEVPQSLNIISGPDYGVVQGQTTKPAKQDYNWIAWYPKSFPVYIYYNNNTLYWRLFPVSPYTYWVPCLSDGYSPLVPPFNVYILYIRSGENAFTVPAGQRLAVIDNQVVEPGKWSEGVHFKAIAPLQPGIYNITAIVWDDAETGLYWTATKEIRVISSLPGSGIIIGQTDIPQQQVVADKPENHPKVLMKRIVYVTNREGFDDYQVRWSANKLPLDAEYISGQTEGTIDFLKNGETVNPSNITYYLPGVVVTTSQITYTSQILPEGNATGEITLYAYNNASTQTYYNVIVNVSKFIPSGWSVIGDEIWKIDSIDPYQNISKTFYLASSTPLVTCNLVNRKTLDLTPGKNIDWQETVKCYNPTTHQLNFTYPYQLPYTATNIKIGNVSTNLIFGKYPYIELNGELNPYEEKYYTITYSTPPITIEISPPTYPSEFYVGDNAKLIVYVTVRNWGINNISFVEAQIPIRYGENLQVFYNSKLIDSKDLVQGYYTLNISNLTSYETRKYMITYETPTANVTIHRYFRRIINKTQYLVYPIEVKSLSDYPLSPLYIRFKEEKPFKCMDVSFVLLTTKDTYLNPNSGTKLNFKCQGNYTIVKLNDLSPGYSEYADVFVLEQKPSATTPFYKPLYDFFDMLINAIKSFVNWIMNFFR